MAEIDNGRPDGVPYEMFVKNGFKLIMDSAQAEKPIQILKSDGTVVFSVDKDGVTVASGAVASKNPGVALSADGAVAIPTNSTDYWITKGTAAALTIADPTATTDDNKRL